MRWQAFAGLGIAVLAGACSSAPDADVASRRDDVTSVAPPPPVQQSIGNCWVFATNAWIESMSARPVGAAAVDLSEAYVSFLYWLDQISAPPAPFTRGTLFKLRATGSWGIAADLLTRFGWMPEAKFLDVATTSTFADRHQTAFEAVQHEIDHGVLQTEAARADRRLVAETLFKAWKLDGEVIDDLTKAFGEAFDRDLVNGHATIAGTRVHRLDEITVGWGAGGDRVSAQDLFGSLPEGEDPFTGLRDGPYAYSDVKPPGSEDKVRAYVRRVQKSLNQDLPVVMSETSDDSDLDGTGTYQKPADGILTDQWYDHAVMVFDLSVMTTRYGLLAAGTKETRPDAIAASLLDDSQVLALRARNSYWGRYADGSIIPFAGGTAVNDYSLEYLLWRPNYAGGRMWMRTTVPNVEDVVIKKTP
jgi:hypothetical protein